MSVLERDERRAGGAVDDRDLADGADALVELVEGVVDGLLAVGVEPRLDRLALEGGDLLAVVLAHDERRADDGVTLGLEAGGRQHLERALVGLADEGDTRVVVADQEHRADVLPLGAVDRAVGLEEPVEHHPEHLLGVGLAAEALAPRRRADVVALDGGDAAEHDGVVVAVLSLRLDDRLVDAGARLVEVHHRVDVQAHHVHLGRAVVLVDAGAERDHAGRVVALLDELPQRAVDLLRRADDGAQVDVVRPGLDTRRQVQAADGGQGDERIRVLHVVQYLLVVCGRIAATGCLLPRAPCPVLHVCQKAPKSSPGNAAKYNAHLKSRQVFSYPQLDLPQKIRYSPPC